MIIDVHRHMWSVQERYPSDFADLPGQELSPPPGLDWRRTTHEMIDEMDGAGVDVAVLIVADFASRLGEPPFSIEEENRFIAEARDLYPERIIAFYGIDPRRPGAADGFQKAIEELKVYQTVSLPASPPDGSQVTGTPAQMHPASHLLPQKTYQVLLSRVHGAAHLLPHFPHSLGLHLPKGFQHSRGVLPGNQVLLGQHHQMGLIEEVVGVQGRGVGILRECRDAGQQRLHEADARGAISLVFSVRLLSQSILLTALRARLSPRDTS